MAVFACCVSFDHIAQNIDALSSRTPGSIGFYPVINYCQCQGINEPGNGKTGKCPLFLVPA